MRIFNLIIKTTKQYEDDLQRSTKKEMRILWSALSPVMHSFEELKRNTWDIDRVNWMQKWLIDIFEKRG